MYIRTKSSRNSPRKSVQIVESIRNGKSVSQRIVQYIGVAFDDNELVKLRLLAEQVMEQLERQRKGKDLFSESELSEANQPFEKVVDNDVTAKIVDLENESTVVEGPIEVAEKIFSYMGYDMVFGDTTRDYGNRTLLKQILAGILARPSSVAAHGKCPQKAQ